MPRRTAYNPGLGTRAADHLSQGGSLSALARDLGVHRDTLYAWAKTHPAFAAATGIGAPTIVAAPPPATIRPKGAAIFSLAAWNLPIDLAQQRVYGGMTADEVDERLFGAQMARAA